MSHLDRVRDGLDELKGMLDEAIANAKISRPELDLWKFTFTAPPPNAHLMTGIVLDRRYTVQGRMEAVDALGKLLEKAKSNPVYPDIHVAWQEGFDAGIAKAQHQSFLDGVESERKRIAALIDEREPRLQGRT